MRSAIILAALFSSLNAHAKVTFHTPISSFYSEEIVETLESAIKEPQQLHRIASTSELWKNHRLQRCHVQGISVGGGQTIVSCMTKYPNNSSAKRAGYLHTFSFYSIDSKLTPVRGRPNPHAVVGQGVEVRGHPRIKYLVPVGSEGDAPAVIDLINQDGEVEYSFSPENISNRKYVGAASVALTVVNEKLYWIGVDHVDLYIYEIQYDQHSGSFKSSYSFASKAPDIVDGWWRRNGRGVFDMGYQAIATLTNKQKDLILLASTGRHLDVWEIANFAQPNMTLDKLGSIKAPFLRGKPLFFEGLGVEHFTAEKFRIWVAPWDYRRIRCGSIRADRLCTHLWSFDVSTR